MIRFLLLFAAITAYSSVYSRNVTLIPDWIEKNYDSVGKASFEASIDSLATFGYFISFGATTGPAPDVSPYLLQSRGSLYFTRPTLADYCKAREDLVHSANRVFEMISSGAVKINIDHRFKLADVVAAHRALEAGETSGSTLLLP